MADEKLLLGVIKTEMTAIAEKYGDDRRSKIGYDELDKMCIRDSIAVTYADNFFLPFARLAAKTFLPPGVLILALKP